MQLVGDMVDEAGIHQEAAVFYAFHKPMEKVAKLSGSSRPWSRLLPVVPRTGSHTGKRLRALPQFFTHSFRRLLRKQQNSGAPMMPCAVDYFEGIKRFIHLGMPVGLKGRQLTRLEKHWISLSMFGLVILTWKRFTKCWIIDFNRLC